MKGYLTAKSGTAVLLIFSILTFFVTFIKIDVSCNEFCQSLFVTPAIAPYKHLTEKKSAETERNDVADVENPVVPVVRHPFKSADVSDLGVIKFPVPEFLKKTQTFDDLQKRKQFLNNACLYASRVYEKSKTLNHEGRIKLQKEIQELHESKGEKPCIPALPNRGSKLGHFYNDTFKFSVCLPTKTGSTNWLKALVALVKDKQPEYVSDRDTWYGLDRFPQTPGEASQFKKGRTVDQGFMTFITVRHPLSRLYSAWHDKFRKGHPWMKPIKKNYGDFLDRLERKNMKTEEFEYSFEAFLELVAISEFDFQRDRHWQTFMFYCGTCNFDYDFIIKNEDAYNDNKFILWAMGLQRKTHVPGKYKGAVSMDMMLEPYKNVPLPVLEKIYRNFYSDFVFYNYTIDDALAIANKTDDPKWNENRKLVFIDLKKKFLPIERNSNEETCEPNVPDYVYDYA